ncbi:immunoglobulin-like domain-containing protein [Carnobacterium gallinarum]|uniref:immunoglobulin-like domain-containing protein n=1 Tax=Carnobacterium gallinarum TaxID=2749 RepID=UPI00068C3C53|nr:immunoglobulin-like domain-containing protein [Carnobacterium gallinarum]
MIKLKLVGLGMVLCCGITLGQLSADAATLEGTAGQGTTLESYLPNKVMMQENPIQSLIKDPRGAGLFPFVQDDVNGVTGVANYLSNTNHITTNTTIVRINKIPGYSKFVLYSYENTHFDGVEQNGYIYFYVNLDAGKHQIQGNKGGQRDLLSAFNVEDAPNEGPVITAKNRTIEVGSDFKPLDGVKATDKEDGDLTKFIKVTSYNVDTDTPGEYEVSYEVTDSKGAIGRATANISVIKRNELPVITAPDRTIEVGSDFKPLDGVKATDKEDGDLTKFIKVTSYNVDTDTPGEYEVSYEVADSKGAIGRATAKITVIKRNELPVITAPDRTIRVGSKFNPLEGVTAYDKENGFLRDIKVKFDNVDTTKTGEYKVQYEVTDSDGGVGKATAKITVIKRNELPVITAPDRTIEVGSEFNPLEGVTAYDEEDGVLTNTQVISDNVNLDVPGIYEVRYQVVDSDNGIGTATAKITVVNTELAMPVVNEVLNTDKIITGTAVKNTTLYLTIGLHEYKVLVGTDGTFSTILDSTYAAGTVIKAYSKDSEGKTSKTYTGIVNAKDVLLLNQVTTADKKITGTTIPNVDVTVAVDTADISRSRMYHGTSDAAGNFTITFTKAYVVDSTIEVTVINPSTGHELIKSTHVVTP